MLLLIVACTDHSDKFTGLDPSDPPGKWTGIGDYEPCYLRLKRTRRPTIRVNCFTIDEVLHTHSSRFVNFNQRFGESWVDTVVRDNRISVLIQGTVYNLAANRITDEDRRRVILENRGYDPIPDGIRVFMLLPLKAAAG